MKAVSDQNSRVKDPVYHIMLSWAPKENPTDTEAFAAAQHAINAVGMGGHQFVTAIHRDTDNVHVHIAVNRVNPDSLNAVYPDRDYYKLDYAMRELEIANRWQRVEGVYSIFERDGKQVIDWTSSKVDSKGKRPSKAADMERFEGTESLFTFARGEPRRAISAILKRDDLTWQVVHWQLAKFGLELSPKGRGLVVRPIGNLDTTPIKASDLHEDLTLGRLGIRLGEYESPLPVQVEPDITYNKHKPLKRDPLEREKLRLERADLRKRLRKDYASYKTNFVRQVVDIKGHLREISELARSRRAEIKASSASAAAKKALYSVIAFETMRDKQRVLAEAATQREALRRDPNNRALTFRKWVEGQAEDGDPAAISQLRGWAYAEKRKAKQLQAVVTSQNSNGMAGSHDADPRLSRLWSQGRARVKQDGTVLYQDIKQVDVLIDHGRALHVAAGRALTPSELEASLRVAVEKFDGSLLLTGSDAFKTAAIKALVQHGIEVVLLDSAQEAQRKALMTERRGAGTTAAPERKK